MARRSQTGRQVWWRVSTSCFYLGDFFPLANNLSSAVMFCGHCTLSYLGVLSYRFFPLSFHLFVSHLTTCFPCYVICIFRLFSSSSLFFFLLEPTGKFRSMDRKTKSSSFPFSLFFSLLSRFLSRLGEDNDDLVLLSCPSSFFPFYFYLSLSNGHWIWQSEDWSQSNVISSECHNLAAVKDWIAV